MLYMLISTHSPENCPMGNLEMAKKAQSAWQNAEVVGKKLGVTTKGSWASIGPHKTFMLLDAPNEFAINQMGMELGLIAWNTSDIYPVMTMEEGMARLK